MVEEVLNLKSLEAQASATHEALEGFIEKANKELSETKSVSTDTKNALDKLAEKSADIGARLAEMEQKQATRVEESKEEFKTAGQMLVESEQFKNFREGGPQGQYQKAKVEVKTTVVNDYTGGMAQPLVAGQRLNMVWREPDRPLRIRDVLPQSRTDSNTIFYTKQSSFTNNAGYLYA